MVDSLNPFYSSPQGRVFLKQFQSSREVEQRDEDENGG